MKNFLTTLIILILLGVGTYFFFPHDSLDVTPSSTPAASSSPVLHLPGKDISLLLADTEEERELGLGGRTSLSDTEAMLFVFDTPDTYEFWMKDMKFPIDIIWLNSDKKVVHIESHVAPETYPDTTFSPEEPSLYVLEAAAGFAQKNTIKVGDTLNFDLKK